MTIRIAAGAVALCVALGCDDRSRLPEPEVGEPAHAQGVTVTGVEAVGGHQVRFASLYLRKAFARAARMCHPPPATRAAVTMTVDRKGYITEIGLDTPDDAIGACLAKHVEKERLPRVKRRSLVSAKIEFLE